MIANYSSGRDELIKQFRTIIPDTVAIIGEELTVVYQGVDTEAKQPTDKFWARFSQQTVLERQTALSGNDLKRRYTADGLVFIQLFIPDDKLANYEKGTLLAGLIKTAFRGKQTENCIWFRNTRVDDSIPKEAAWFRLNVVSEYHYDEIG